MSAAKTGVKTFDELLAASSFGTPEAIAIRGGGPAARRAIAKADKRARGRGYLCKRCRQWVDGFGFGCEC